MNDYKRNSLTLTLLMTFSMVINESLVARKFGTYTLQLFDVGQNSINSGGEIEKPNKNVRQAIIISLVFCTVVYLLVTFAVSANLSIAEIVKARNFSLAEAARPAFGK